MPLYYRGGSSMGASNFISDERLNHQHMGVMYDRGTILSASTGESYRGRLNHIEL